MKTKILIMRPDEPHETREVELPDPNKSLEMVQALNRLVEPLVGHDWIEHVNVWADFKGGTNYKYLDMFVNENGKLHGLPINGDATDIYRRNVLYHEPGKYKPEELDVIVGPAVLFERKVWK